MYYLNEMYLDDGTPVRLCPLGMTDNKPLYCSVDGRFFSYVGFYLHRVKPDTNSGKLNEAGYHVTANGIQCSRCYPKMRCFGNAKCHLLMATTWIGPRPEGYECDHLNGDIYNWSIDNLEWVTREENYRRAKLLRLQRTMAKLDNRPDQLPENMPTHYWRTVFHDPLQYEYLTQLLKEHIEFRKQQLKNKKQQ